MRGGRDVFNMWLTREFARGSAWDVEEAISSPRA